MRTVEAKTPTVVELVELASVNEPRAQRLLESDAVFIRVVEDGKTVGVSWASGDGKQWLVGGNFVHPQYRRRGIATGMRNALVEELRQQTVGRGILYGIHFVGGKEFYEALGWKLVGRQRTAYRKFQGKL